MNKHFFGKIPILQSFRESLSTRHLHTVPDNWHIVITDIKGSTKAIENGRYQDINAIGAASIAVLLNIDPELELPFVFGGDGATILIPEGILGKTKSELIILQQRARQFSLELRVAIFSVKEMKNEGFSLQINKWKSGDSYSQATLMGNMLDEAENRLKKTDKYLLIPQSSLELAKLKGFTCRWQPVPSPKEEILSVVIKFIENDHKEVLKQILEKIEKVFGKSTSHHPLNPDLMNLTLNQKSLKIENQLVGQKNPITLLAEQLIGKGMNIFYKLTGKSNYFIERKTGTFLNSDCKKYDGSLKFIITSASNEKEEFEKYLQNLYEKNQVFYGIFNSSHSLITCVVTKPNSKEVHFIDGGDGGYALAAKKMKSQIQQKILNLNIQQI